MMFKNKKQYRTYSSTLRIVNIFTKMEVDVNYKIREVRTLKGYNQAFVAKKLRISQRAFSKIEFLLMPHRFCLAK